MFNKAREIRVRIRKSAQRLAAKDPIASQVMCAPPMLGDPGLK
jgi:hypothetical protein